MKEKVGILLTGLAMSMAIACSTPTVQEPADVYNPTEGLYPQKVRAICGTPIFLTWVMSKSDHESRVDNPEKYIGQCQSMRGVVTGNKSYTRAVKSGLFDSGIDADAIKGGHYFRYADLMGGASHYTPSPYFGLVWWTDGDLDDEWGGLVAGDLIEVTGKFVGAYQNVPEFHGVKFRLIGNISNPDNLRNRTGY